MELGESRQGGAKASDGKDGTRRGGCEILEAKFRKVHSQ